MKCPKCQFDNPEGAKFCIECGHKFGEELAIEEERKQVTVLFSDLTEYTSMSERLDPEEVKNIMSRIFGEVTHVVAKYDGSIQKFIGDAVVAFFGVPKVHEDDPVRAIRTAIEINEIVNGISPQFESRIGKRLAMHTGINTGLVVTGEITTGKGILGVTGDTVNVAQRLSAVAKPGEILVGQDTNRQAEWLFNLAPLSPVSVKGKAEPVQVYRVTGIKEKKGRTLGVDSPLVGRGKEMDLLSLQVFRLINGTGGIVTISGEAGIGKSRLMAELRQKDPIKRTILLEGRALSMGRSLSFYPVIEALKHWSQIKENDTDTEAQRKLEKAIRDIHSEEVGEIFPFIATLMGMKLAGKYAERVKGIEGESLEKLIFKNMRELLIKSSEIRPLIIYIEDFHWVDTSSLELIKALLRLVVEYRILFISVYRPGYTDTGERITAFIQENYPSNWTKIELEPLKETESEQLLSNLLRIKNFPHQLREQILQRAGGNPFFIEEVVRSLINEGAVVLERGEYRVTEKIRNIVIPQSIHALIMSRIDRLDEETRNLVKVASVIGRNFFYKILTEVATYIEEVDKRLDYLKEIQLIRERKRMEEVEYLFKHALAQEAAYESILIQRRKEIHQKVALSIEKVFNERLHEFYGMLAYHYGRAEDLEKSEEYLIKAGEEALRVAASDEALHYYMEALQLYLKKSGDGADPEKVAMLEKNIALALYNRAHYIEAVEYFDKALNYYWRKLPSNAFSRIIEFLSSLLHFVTALFIPSLKFKGTPTQRDLQVFDLLYKKCKALAVTNPKRSFIEFFFFHKRITAFDLQKIENGTGIFVSASTLFSFSGISFGLSRRILDFAKNRICRDDLRNYTIYDLCETIHNFLEGNWKEIRNYDDDLIKRNCDIGDFWDATQLLYWHALPCIHQGSLEIAESILSRLDDIFQVYQYDLAKTYKHDLKSRLLMECRRFNDALIESKEGIDFEEKAGPGFWELYVCEARIYTLMGEIEKAEKCLEQANRIWRKIRPVPFQMTGFYIAELEYNLYRLKEILRSGNKTKLSEYRKKAMRSVKMLLRNGRKVAQCRTESYKLAGEYYWLLNKQKKALNWWHYAIREGERLDAPLQLAGVYFELGKRLLGPGSKYRVLDGISAEDYLEKAKPVFEEMKLQFYLDQLDQVIRG